jgi:peptide/nickel transport system substrate-binding protein
MDPHAVALLINYRVCTQIYESLINRDEAFRVEPALAIRWEPLDGARRWRFWLRPGVSFHDGSPFVADDAVFSIKRALGSTSGRRFQLDGITAIRKVDDLTIDVVLAAPDAVLPEKLDQVGR